MARIAALALIFLAILLAGAVLVAPDLTLEQRTAVLSGVGGVLLVLSRRRGR